MDRRGEVYEVRRSLVEGMWADGWPEKEIKQVLGWGPRSSLSVLRTYGYDLPHRYGAVHRQNMFEGRWLAA